LTRSESQAEGMVNIKHIVREYIVENLLLGGQADEVTDDASLLDTGVLDSTGVVELVSFLEKTFAITVLDEEMLPEHLDGLDRIQDYVLSKLG
jgi:acyl carrier protein